MTSPPRHRGTAPRVAVIGKRNVLHWDEHVVQGLEAAGCEVAHYRVNRRPPALALARGALKVAAGRRRAEDVTDRWHAERVRRGLERFRPDLVLGVSVFFLPLPYLAAADSLSPRPIVAGWDGDAAIRYESAAAYAGYLDVAYTIERGCIEAARGVFRDVRYLTFGANPEIYRDRGLERSHAVYFCGAWTEERERLVRELHGIPAVVRGPGWRRFDPPARGFTVRPGKVGMDGQARDYAAHTVVFNQHQAVNNPVSALNIRDFEAPASGALLLSDHRDDFALHYEPGTEILTYRDADELGGLLERCAAEPGWVAACAARGMRRVHTGHTYRHRVREILDLL